MCSFSHHQYLQSRESLKKSPFSLTFGGYNFKKDTIRSKTRCPMKSTIAYKWIVAAVFVCGLFMDLMDTTIVNVALPALGRRFDASNTTLEWVVTGYLLSLAVWIPASGWLGDRVGTKRVFLFALATFSAAS